MNKLTGSLIVLGTVAVLAAGCNPTRENESEPEAPKAERPTAAKPVSDTASVKVQSTKPAVEHTSAKPSQEAKPAAERTAAVKAEKPKPAKQPAVPKAPKNEICH